MGLTFQEPRQGRGRAHIPDYVAEHPGFARKVQDCYSEMSGGADDDDDPFERLLLLEACMVMVAEEHRAAIRHTAPLIAGARLGCALRAWRAWRGGNASRLQAKVQRMPELSDAERRACAGEGDMLREAGRAYGETGAAENIAGVAREGPGPGDMAAKGRTQVERARRRATLWAPRGRQVRLVVARCDAGAALQTRKSLELITTCLAEQFAPSAKDPAQQAAWLVHAAPRVREVPAVTRASCGCIVRTEAELARADWATCVPWVKAGELAADMLWAAAEALMVGVTAPSWVNMSCTVLVPNGSEAGRHWEGIRQGCPASGSVGRSL